MKHLFFAGLAVCICMAGYSQTSTPVIQNKLQIPVSSELGAIKISKSELSKVEVITSSQGKVEGYTIGFKMDDDNYFSKKSEMDSLNTYVKEKLIGLKAGTHFYLFSVQIKATDNAALAEKRYEFILTD